MATTTILIMTSSAELYNDVREASQAEAGQAVSPFKLGVSSLLDENDNCRHT